MDRELVEAAVESAARGATGGGRQAVAAAVAAAVRSLGLGPGPSAGDSCAGGKCKLEALEEALAAVAYGLGCPADRFTVPQAKAALRERGEAGSSLAARLGRMSKGRNARAHPDVGLVAAIVHLLRGGGCRDPRGAVAAPFAGAQ